MGPVTTRQSCLSRNHSHERKLLRAPRHIQRLTKATLPLARPHRGTVWLCHSRVDVCAGIPGAISSPRCPALWGRGGSAQPVPTGLQVGSTSGGPGRRSESWRRETPSAPPASSLPWVQVPETAAAFTTPPPALSSGKDTSHLGSPTRTSSYPTPKQAQPESTSFMQ